MQHHKIEIKKATQKGRSQQCFKNGCLHKISEVADTDIIDLLKEIQSHAKNDRKREQGKLEEKIKPL